ncbi:transglutaminaseTgpA domain-containing protein [Krasilnikovia sp. MM14-A1259]|uniref:transglutaminaseTgpA domain-containing protein n=1 Tax=Krasilnikovia sp. MM14-A1259 TaxID=3373539 RepID=UPI0037F468F9
MVRWLRAAVAPLALAGLIALAGMALGRIYADALLAQLVAGAAVGSIGVSVAARRLPSWSVAPLSVLVLAGYAVGAVRIAAAHAALTDPLPTVVADALANGIPRLLTAMIPVEPTPDTVIVPVVAAWLAGLAGAELALRGGRVLLGCLPPALLYAGALYVVGPNEAAAGRPTLAFAGLVIAALAATARPDGSTPDAFTPDGATPDRPASDGSDGAAPDAGLSARTRAAMRGRALAGAAAGLAVLVGLVAMVGPWVSSRVSAAPSDPRRYVQPPQVDSLDESPLNRISGWALDPGQRLLDVSPDPAVSASASARPSGAEPAKRTGGDGARRRTLRLRLAVLPDYDGVTWRVGATYRNAGRVLPTQAPLPGADVHEVHQRIRVEGLTGRLLPALPTPATVSGARVAFDPATGTLIRPEGLTPGLQYEVTSQVQAPDLNLLPTAGTPSGDAVARYLTVGGVAPPQIQRLADQLADGNGAAYDRAVAIENFLAEHYRQVPDAPSGHAYPNLSFFLFGPRGRGGQVGTSEQFAASFALLARLTGLPSRVVVGFDAPVQGGAVTAGDAIAWPEILFDDLGWVPFDPLPKSKQPPRPVEQDFTPKPPTTSPSTPEAPTPSDTATASAPPSALAAGTGRGVSAPVVAGGAGGSILVVLLAAAATVVTLRRGLRRRRLTEGGSAERITGAWFEVTDALRLAGHPVPHHLAAAEVARFAANPGRRLAAGNLLPGHPPGDPVSRRGHTSGDAAGRSPHALDDLADRPGHTPGDPVSRPRQAPSDPAGHSGHAPKAAGRRLRRAAPHTRPGRTDPGPLPPLDELVAGVNTLLFAPDAADGDQARRAGDQAVAYADTLRAHRSWWRRLWWSVHPGPLRWHRRRE